MNLGNRIIFDQDGDIVFQTGEMTGDVLPRKELSELHSIDIEFGAIDLHTHRIVSINMDTKQPVLKKIGEDPSPDERIQELENQLLLQEDQNVGGIL